MEITKSDKTALVVGATGLVGHHLQRLLLEEEHYANVRILVRRPLTWEHPKLEIKYIDFDRLEDYPALFAVDDIFCCLGTTMAKAGSKEAFYKVDYTYVYETARLGAAQNANQFSLVSSVGASKESAFFYSRVKGEIEEAVSNMPYWAHHIFRPSFLDGHRDESRWGEGIGIRLARGLNFLTGGLFKHYKPIEASLLAKAMIKTAQNFTEGIHIYENEEIPDLVEETSLQ